MYMDDVISGDFIFEYTVGDSSTATWSQAGIFAANESGSFGNSHLPGSLSGITNSGTSIPMAVKSLTAGPLSVQCPDHTPVALLYNSNVRAAQ